MGGRGPSTGAHISTLDGKAIPTGHSGSQSQPFPPTKPRLRSACMKEVSSALNTNQLSIIAL